jgi:hypothetical protein
LGLGFTRIVFSGLNSKPSWRLHIQTAFFLGFLQNLNTYASNNPIAIPFKVIIYSAVFSPVSQDILILKEILIHFTALEGMKYF